MTRRNVRMGCLLTSVVLFGLIASAVRDARIAAIRTADR